MLLGHLTAPTLGTLQSLIGCTAPLRPVPGLSYEYPDVRLRPKIDTNSSPNQFIDFLDEYLAYTRTRLHLYRAALFAATSFSVSSLVRLRQAAIWASLGSTKRVS